MSASDLDQEKKYFTESGECKDEIKLIFDDGNILYVSENFLTYASPVFKAMFEHEFTEKVTREVKLPGKKYEHFLEFLLTLHPAVQKPVDYENVLDITAIVDEYQVTLLINKCKTVMKKWLKSEYEYIKQTSMKDEELRERVSSCLLILCKSLQCKFEDVTEYAIKAVSRFGYGVFTGKLKKVFTTNNINVYRHNQSINRDNYVTEDEEAADTVCHNLFSDLPEDIKNKLIAERMMVCDKNTTL